MSLINNTESTNLSARPLHDGDHAEGELRGPSDGVVPAALGVVEADEAVLAEARLGRNHAEVAPQVRHDLPQILKGGNFNFFSEFGLMISFEC